MRITMYVSCRSAVDGLACGDGSRSGLMPLSVYTWCDANNLVMMQVVRCYVIGYRLCCCIGCIAMIGWLVGWLQQSMRLLSLVLQNKKGENIIIATSPAIHTRTCILYSNFIYEHILQTYRRRLKIERTLTLEPNLLCVLSINKDFILYVFVAKFDLSLAFDAVKKVTEFINSTAKMFGGATGAARLDVISKKFVEFMSVMEQFLYTREISIREYLPLLPQPFSKKKNVDQQVFNKFTHITNELDRKILYDTHAQSAGIEGLQTKKKSKVFDQAKKFVIKSQDDLDLLEVDAQKQNYITRYRKNIIHFAGCGRRKQPTLNLNTLSQLTGSQIEIQPEQILEQQQAIDETFIQREKIRLRMNQKLELSLQNAKIKEVLQFGQLTIEGTQKETGVVELCSPELYWGNKDVINKRLSPNSLDSLSELSNKIKFTTEPNYKSKPIIDYIIRKESFTPDKVPLLFVYTREVSTSNIEFTFKYKLNEKWKHRLFDVDISVYLNKQFLVMDCKSVPSAYSLKNNKITWKTKEILPNANNSKGKIILAFGSTNIAPKHIIKEIKLNMKANCGLIDNLRAECVQDFGYRSEAEKMLLIQYKISPNDEQKDA